jgi:hypothetical protein
MISKILKYLDNLYLNSYTNTSRVRKENAELPGSIYDYTLKLKLKIDELEARCENLEQENVSLTNELYRMENSLDSRIDIMWSEFEKIRSSEP